MRYATRAGAVAMTAALAAVLLQAGSRPLAVAADSQPEVDADLALVPADAVGFVHIRAADLWKNEIFAGFRQTFESAGPKALAALDSQFVPKVSTFDRATTFLLLGEQHQPLPYIVLQFTAPFNPDDVANAYLPGADKTNHGGKTVYHGGRSDFDLYFPDNRHIVIAAPDTMLRYLKREMPPTGPLSPALKLAASGKPVVAALNVAALPIPPQALEVLPMAARPLLKADYVALSLDLTKSARVDLVAGYKDEKQAVEAERAVKILAEFARKELATLKTDIEKQLYEPRSKPPRPLDQLPEAVLSVFALGAIGHVDQLLANPGAIVKRSGADLTASVTIPKELIAGASSVAAMSTALLVPAVQKIRMAAARMQGQNNLKQIALAIHNYEATYGNLPHDITDKDGKPILSWRVAILPFIKQDNLYKQFKLDEPWDSDHNKKWSETVIKVFTSPHAPLPFEPGMTQYKAFAGPGTIFESGKVIRFNDILDGTSNTIMVVEAGEPIPWAKPGDIPYDPKKPLPKLALPGVADFINVAMCDGSVRTLNMKKLTERTLRNAITRDDGNILGEDFGK